MWKFSFFLKVLEDLLILKSLSRKSNGVDRVCQPGGVSTPRAQVSQRDWGTSNPLLTGILTLLCVPVVAYLLDLYSYEFF